MARGTEAAPPPTLRVGLFGGTFDPPHLGHVTVAADMADELRLQTVVWMPAAVPPHKQDADITPDDLRLEMVEAACRADPRFQASNMELMRGGVSYTVDTLGLLQRQWPGTQLYLILGVDQFRTMAHGWKDPEDVFRRATVAVMDREGADARDAVPDVAGSDNAVFVSVTRVDVSSTGIRAAVAAGRDVSEQVPPEVLAIMEREGLYRP